MFTVVCMLQVQLTLEQGRFELCGRIEKKCVYKWTHEVQAHIVQGKTVLLETELRKELAVLKQTKKKV